tara:strand:+ start:1044 stop:1337 length:294 start_codon:yes stop_codon:yes gene_type:complete
MANTTFTGPVTSLNGFIGGANVNATDTQQGGSVAWSVSNDTTLTIATGTRAGETLLATANEGVMVYTSNGATGNAVYAFSDGTNWLRMDTRVAVATS